MIALALAAVLATPQVTEFGGTFGSDLGGIALARDGSVWVNEHDRVAHVERNGSVHEYRVPVDVEQSRPSAAGSIGLGPGGDMWFAVDTGVGRVSPDGRIRLYEVAPRSTQRYVTALTVAPNGAWFAFFNGPRGVARLDARGIRTMSDTDLTDINGLVAAPDGTLWIAATSTDGKVSMYRRAADGVRRRVAGMTSKTFSMLSATSGAVAIARVEWNAAQRAYAERIDAGGQVTTLTDFAIAGYSTQIGGATFARDGTMWITEPGRNRIAQIAPDGTLHDVRRGLPDNAAPFGIASDDAGGAWFTDISNGTVGHAAADGTISLIGHGPIPESTPAYPAVASDGAVWYRESFDWRRRLARLAPDGTLREFPNVGSGPLLARDRDVLTSTVHGIVAVRPDGAVRTIAARVVPRPEDAPADSPPEENYRQPFATAAATAPDGAAWFAVEGALARIDRNGAVRTIPMRDLRPESMAFDVKGTLWFTETGHSLIGSVAQDGRVRTHTRGFTRWNSGPQWIARGPDGAMWFTEIRDGIGRITPSGRITEFAHALPHRSSPGGIVAGPDGALWFTLWHGNVLGRVTTDGRIALHRGLVTASRGNEHDPDAVLVPDGRGGYWFNESQGGRMAHLTFR